MKSEANIHAQLNAIQASQMLAITEDNRGLHNPFSQKMATAIQQHDLLHFRTTGEQEFLQCISTVILKQPSVKAPNRRKRLCTF